MNWFRGCLQKSNPERVEGVGFCFEAFKGTGYYYIMRKGVGSRPVRKRGPQRWGYWGGAVGRSCSQGRACVLGPLRDLAKGEATFAGPQETRIPLEKGLEPTPPKRPRRAEKKKERKAECQMAM